MVQIKPAMELMMVLSLLQSRLQRKIDQRLCVHGISFTEFMVMYHLYQAPEMTMRRIDLAERVGLTASGVTRMLIPMEKIKLVQRKANPRDARVSLTKLSKAGEQVFQDALVTIEESASLLLEGLKPEQVKEFVELARGVM